MDFDFEISRVDYSLTMMQCVSAESSAAIKSNWVGASMLH